MPLELVTIPCLADNYAFLLHDETSGATALVDVPEADAVLQVLHRRGWSLDEVWITHHHADHSQGLENVLKVHPAKVTGAAADAHRLPHLDREVADGDRFDFAGHGVEVMDVSGHTVGHVAFYVEDGSVVFTADSLMALGCGRLFEGTAEQMWVSLSRLASLPPETTVCSGHEYTAANAKFALTIDPDNPELIFRAEEVTAARKRNEPTVPSNLAREIETNPFLRAADHRIRERLGMASATDAEVFAEIRARKDAF